ncbi:MAG: cohesin domain-containing protein [Patescibacteria group bacterium]|nr:cohesin domain-containing protein [Patescibacteria group bacterium]
MIEIVFKNKINYLLFFEILLLLPIFVFGAQIEFLPYIGIGQKFYEINVDQEFKVDIYLNSENESINAFSGEIVYPADLIELKNILDGNSIINYWVDKPVNLPIYFDNVLTNKNKIYFSGITPGGFNGRSGLLLSLIFKAKNSGSGFISFQNSKFLLNDGQGTEILVKTNDFKFNILSSGTKIIDSNQVVLPIDNMPPEDFKPEVLQNPEMFDGKYFLVFQTQDKGRGIDHYEVLEWKNKFSIFDIFKKIIWPQKYNLNSKSWTKTDSPYVLLDQKLQSNIYVKAVDKAGNEKIVFLSAQNQIKWYENYENWIIIIIVLIIIILIRLKFKKKFKNEL